MSIDPKPDFPESTRRRRGRPPKASSAPSTPSDQPPANPMTDTREMARLLKLAADPSRLRSLFALLDGERNVTDLCREVGITQPALSHHLALLRAGRLIDPRRKGKFNYYALTAAGRVLAQAVTQVGG